jgi:NhaA family Na+:H+ antiporter
VVVPLFALANAGVSLSADAVQDAAGSPVALGIVAGLLAGKTVGIAAFAWLAVRLRVAELPAGTRWSGIFGVGLIAGIGFTVSLFTTELAFTDPALIQEAKIGIFAASIVAGLAGYGYLRAVTARIQRPSPAP